jgi:hypothetical protein
MDVKNLPNLVRYGDYSLLGYTACSRVDVYCLYNLLLSSSGPSIAKILAAGSSETSVRVCIYGAAPYQEDYLNSPPST